MTESEKLEYQKKVDDFLDYLPPPGSKLSDLHLEYVKLAFLSGAGMGLGMAKECGCVPSEIDEIGKDVKECIRDSFVRINVFSDKTMSN